MDLRENCILMMGCQGIGLVISIWKLALVRIRGGDGNHEVHLRGA